jgi:hypothetical protein
LEWVVIIPRIYKFRKVKSGNPSIPTRLAAKRDTGAPEESGEIIFLLLRKVKLAGAPVSLQTCHAHIQGGRLWAHMLNA